MQDDMALYHCPTTKRLLSSRVSMHTCSIYSHSHICMQRHLLKEHILSTHVPSKGKLVNWGGGFSHLLGYDNSEQVVNPLIEKPCGFVLLGE